MEMVRAHGTQDELILPLPFCENVQVYAEVSTHRITIWVLMDTWLYLLYYISIHFSILGLCHPPVWSVSDSTSTKAILQSPSVIMWSFALWDSQGHSKPGVGCTKCGVLVDSCTDFQPILLFLSFTSLT